MTCARTLTSRARRLAFGLFALGLCLGSITLSAPLRADAPPGRYQLRACGTVVFDTKTKLEWQRGENAPADVANAFGVCGTLPLDRGGWRVPTMLELSSIQDLATSSPAIDRRAFPDTSSANFATASQPVPGTNPPSYWVLSFKTGVPDVAISTTPGASVSSRCVRSLRTP
ncbi:MAG: DUF1566 domain-containing protein [Myxococcales bacterium]|nr:DUF1566 domain-containing protein [Myxococcales bacterium]